MNFGDEESTHNTVYPWDTLELDVKTQTGGDWYKMLLASSLHGKIIHGANTSPTCEVLAKVPDNRKDEPNHGLLTWDDELLVENHLGDDIADKMYKHHNYQGSVTLSGACLAYDIGLWEPSARKRARSSALLAAGMCVNGMTRSDALLISSKIVGESIDPEAVDSALIPASHLKREMTLVSKANHRVFGRGSIQRGITWYDTGLTTDSRYKFVAFDWGRVTAVARYIAEANIQNCEKFRLIAKHYGVPYMLVRNTWAYVTESDYRFNVSDFDSVPELDCRSYGIPTIRGLFEGHEQEVMFALSRGASKYGQLAENDSFKGYFDLMREARRKKHGRERIRIADISTAQEYTVGQDVITAEDAADVLIGANAARDAFLKAIASRRAADDLFSQQLTRVSSLNPKDERHFSLIDDVSKILYDQQSWFIAKQVIETSIAVNPGECSPNKERAISNLISQLTRLKKEIFGYMSHLTSGSGFTNSILASNRARTVAYCRDSLGVISPVIYNQRSLVSRQVRETMNALSNIELVHFDALKRVNTEMAGLFKDWGERSFEAKVEELHMHGTRCVFVWKALESLTSSLCAERTHGYVEGTTPRRSYIFQAVVTLSGLFPHCEVTLARPSYIDARQIALDLDSRYELPYAVTNMVEYTKTILDRVVGELLVGRVWEPNKSDYEEVLMAFAPMRSPQYDTSMMEDAEYEAIAYAAIEDYASSNEDTDTYEACLNSYKSEVEANKYARAMGFQNLRQAWTQLGTDAYYYEENPRIIEAQAKMNAEMLGQSSSSSSGEDGFEQVI